MMYRTVLAAGIIMAMLASAKAEQSVEVLFGRSWNPSRPATISVDSARIDDKLVPAELRVRLNRLQTTSWRTFALRYNHWWNHIGIGLDIAKVAPDVQRQTVKATANLRFDDTVFGEPVRIEPGAAIAVGLPRITVPDTASLSSVLMWRGSTHGLAPYAYVGPSYVVTSKTLSGSFGVLAGAGVAVPITRRLSIVGEYRSQHVNAEAVAGRVKGSEGADTATTGDIRVGFHIRSSSLAAGLRFKL